MISFELENLEIIQPIEEDWQVFVHIESDFSLRIGERTLYQEIHFNVAEFALSVSQWLKKSKLTRRDYIFESMDTDEVGLLWFKRDGSKWQIGSVHQLYEENSAFDFDEIEKALNRFIEELLPKLPEPVKTRIEAIISSQ